MDTDTLMKPKVHQGRNIKRFRDILGVKQEVLAIKLEFSQQTLSKLEHKEEIEDEILNKVADALKIPVAAIKNMTDESAISIVANTFHDFHDDATVIKHYQHCAFNPIEKIVELYERLLETERDKNK